MTGIERMRGRNDALARFDAECRAEDARQMLADMRELMKLPAFLRVMVAMTRRGRLERSLRDGGSEYARGIEVGFREFAVQFAESAKIADFDAWQKADRERWMIDAERTERRRAIENGNETEASHGN